MSVNESLARDVEGRLIDWEVAKREMDRDGIRTREELLGMFERAERAMPRVGLLARTCQHIANCLAGRDGMHSYTARRGWQESQRAAVDADAA